MDFVPAAIRTAASCPHERCNMPERPHSGLAPVHDATAVVAAPAKTNSSNEQIRIQVKSRLLSEYVREASAFSRRATGEETNRSGRSPREPSAPWADLAGSTAGSPH